MAKLTIHPAADIFPMMSEEELADLAEDIKVNGLVHPLIIDADNHLVDGRNRFAACKLAGVEPHFEQLNGRDPLAYIVSANLNRRNLTKGQQAMALAMIYPEPEKGGRGKRSQNRESLSRTMENRLSQCRSVLRHSRDLAETVLSGVTPLDEALQKVVEEKTRAQGDGARMERLRRGAPDLAELVTEERMPLHEAIHVLNERESRRRATYEAGVSAVGRLIEFSGYVAAIIGGEEARTESDPPIVVKPETVQLAKDTISLLEKFCRRTK